VWGDSPLFLADHLLRFLRVATLLAIWRTILGGRPDAAVDAGAVRMSLETVLAYTLIAAAFGQQINLRTRLDTAIWDGSIVRRFVQPTPLVAQFLADLLGDWSFSLLTFTLPLLLAAPLLGVDPRPASLVAMPLFAVSLALGVCIAIALDFFFAALMVRVNWHVWDLQRIRMAVETLLSGAVLPLALLPWGLGDIFQWLPFASVASAPLRIYTGTASTASAAAGLSLVWTDETLRLLALQCVWAAVLWPLASWFWNANRERVVSYGG
jgi:ABC-type uncharacterized transport system permease subunit